MSMMMAFMPFSSVQMSAVPTPVGLEVGYTDPESTSENPQRGPILVPEVSIEDYTLSIDTSCYGWTLRLVDEDDNVVFSTVITSASVILPSTLEGEYEIQLIPESADYYFYGYILF